MGSKRGVYIVVAAVSIILLGTLWIYDSFISKRPQKVKLGNEETLLQTYVKETMLPDYVPKQLVVEHGLLGNGETTGTNSTSGAFWYVDGVKAYAGIHYTKDLTALSGMEILIVLNRAISLNNDSAKSQLSKYFKQVNKVSCQSSLVCEGFKGGNSVEQGVGIATLDKNFTMLFSCKQFKGGELFGTGSCLGR